MSRLSLAPCAAIRSSPGHRCIRVQREIGRRIFTRWSHLRPGFEHHHHHRQNHHPQHRRSRLPRWLDSTFCDRRETAPGVWVRVACTQIQDSIRPLRECTKIAGEQKKDSSSFTRPDGGTRTRAGATTRTRASFAVAQGKSGSLKAGDET